MVWCCVCRDCEFFGVGLDRHVFRCRVCGGFCGELVRVVISKGKDQGGVELNES